MFKDINELFDRIPIWRKMQGLAGRMEALEAKVAELESRLAVAPGDICKYCGAPAVRLLTPLQPTGEGPGSWCYEHWQCEACHNLEVRVHTF